MRMLSVMRQTARKRQKDGVESVSRRICVGVPRSGWNVEMDGDDDDDVVSDESVLLLLFLLLLLLLVVAVPDNLISRIKSVTTQATILATTPVKMTIRYPVNDHSLFSS